MWLGVGEDGHTLSLFPEHPGFTQTSTQLVIPITHYPKPPSDRITLSRHATSGIENCLIFAVGSGKKAALVEAFQEEKLPIFTVAADIQTAGGNVEWMLDEAARINIQPQT